MNVKIDFRNVNLIYPILNDNHRSLRRKIINIFNKNDDIKYINHIHALKDLTFSINPGERIGIRGHNGSGKTSLLKLISGIFSASSGNLKINGSVSSFIDLHFGLNMEASGYENIKTKLRLLGFEKKFIVEHIPKIINFSELGDFINIAVKNYSSGMLVRLSFSILHFIETDICVMDEWLGVGDVNFQKKSKNAVLRKFTTNDKIFILTSHDDDLLNSCCNRIITLDKGAVIDDKKT